jgi:hypothetical protein
VVFLLSIKNQTTRMRNLTASCFYLRQAKLWHCTNFNREVNCLSTRISTRLTKRHIPLRNFGTFIHLFVHN